MPPKLIYCWPLCQPQWERQPMKAVQIIARGQPVFVDAPKPDLQPGTAVVKTLAWASVAAMSATCITCPIVTIPRPSAKRDMKWSGVIEAIDPAHNSHKIGDRVLCLAPDHRAMCEYYRAPIDRLLPFDPTTPLEHAVQAQQFGTVLFASTHLPDLRGKTAAVIGQGSPASGSTSPCKSAAPPKSSPSTSKPTA